MTDAQLEWMIRNRKSISPAQRKAAFDAWEAKYGKGKDPNRATAEVFFGAPEATPADLDPVEAAASVIAPDPLVGIGPKPSLSAAMGAANTLASADNFNAAFEANGYHYPTAVAAFTQQLIDRGVEPAYAERAARARAEAHRAPHTRDVYADEMASSEDPEELYPGYRNASPRAVPFGAMPDADPRTTKAERLAQHEKWSADVDRRKAQYDRDTGLGEPDAISEEEGPYPGAGRPGYERTFTPGELLAQQEQAEAERRAQWAEERNAAIGAKYGPQARKTAEAADAKGEIDFSAVQSPEEKQMNSYREAIERSARFDPDSERRKASRETRADLERSRSEDRKKFRAQVAAAPKAAADPRMERWKAQSMLAGGQPTGGPRGTKAAANALMMMDEDDRNSSLRYMLPGGQLAAMVDAQNMQNANDVIKRFMTSGAAAGMNNPIALQQMEQMNREKAIARADALIAKYPKGWDGMYDAADVQAVRDAVDKQHPGLGDAAVAHLRVRPAAPAARPGEVAPGSVPPI